MSSKQYSNTVEHSSADEQCEHCIEHAHVSEVCPLHMRIRTRMGSCMLSLLTDYRLVHSSLRLLRPTHTMSSTPSHSGSSREPSPKLDQTSLGEHTKRCWTLAMLTHNYKEYEQLL